MRIINKAKKWGWNVISTVAILFVFASAAPAQGYRPATAEQQKEIMQNINAVSEQMKTLSCDFVQRKTISILADEMVSEGKLSYSQPDKLRWEYIQPYQYRFTLNGSKVMVGSDENKNIIDTNSSKIFKEISKLIVMGINGSGIFEENNFAAKFNIGGDDFQIALTPKQKELKQIFSSITLTFNKADHTVNTVEIKEINGDATFITMKNKQINTELDNEIFVIR